MSSANYQVWVINLANATGRLKRVESLLAQQNIVFERLEAVNGAELEQATIDKFYQEKGFGGYHKKLNNGEIGCYLSHRKAWQQVIDRNLDFAVILEDDFQLLGDLADTIETISHISQPWDYIKLANWKDRRTQHALSLKNKQLVTYDKVPAHTCAQIVSFSGAKKLLGTSECFHRPVDIDIQHWWEKDLDLFGIEPAPIAAMIHPSNIDAVSDRRAANTKPLTRIFNQLSFYWCNKINALKRVKHLSQLSNDEAKLND